MSRLSPIPLVCYLILVAYACYAAATIGHWPYYAHPDPSELPLPSLGNVVLLTTLAGLLSVLLLPVLYGSYRALAAWRKWPISPSRKAVGLYAIGAALWSLDVTFEFVNGPLPSLAGWIFD